MNAPWPLLSLLCAAFGILVGVTADRLAEKLDDWSVVLEPWEDA